jgi:hypothetical protein
LEPPPDHLGSHREIRTLPPPAGQNTRAGDVFFSSLLKDYGTKQSMAPDFKTIASWDEKIKRLLNHHQIQMVEPDLQYWVIMQAHKDGRVHGFEMKRLGQAEASE